MLLKTASNNTVAASGFDNRVIPVGSNAMSYASKYRIHLDYRGAYQHARLDLDHFPPQDNISFAINESWFTDC